MYSRSAPRRRHAPELKAKVLADCDAPGASISAVALAHGLNTNLVRQWRAGRGVKLAGVSVISAGARNAPGPPEDPMPPPVSVSPEFIAIAMPAPPKTATGAVTHSAPTSPPSSHSTAEPYIHVDIRRGPLHLSVRWPSAAADDCRAWLSELSTGLLK